MNIRMTISNIFFWFKRKTWRMRHIWSHGHIPFKVTLNFRSFDCDKYWERQENYDKRRNSNV